MWLHSLKVAQLLRSAACLHTNQSRSYLNHLVHMYMKTKELGWKETQGIHNIGIEDSQGNRVLKQSQVLKILENYITELYDRPNRPETVDVEPEEEVDKMRKAHIFCKVKWKKPSGK